MSAGQGSAWVALGSRYPNAGRSAWRPRLGGNALAKAILSERGMGLRKIRELGLWRRCRLCARIAPGVRRPARESPKTGAAAKPGSRRDRASRDRASRSVRATLPRQQHPPHAGRLGSRATRQVVVASCLAVGAHMDGGRFNFWRLLLCTRAITPPRVPAGPWPGSVFLRRGVWSLLLLVAVLAAGVVVRLSQRDPPVQSAVSPPPTSVPLGPAPPAQRW